jgi:hypothetical protein
MPFFGKAIFVSQQTFHQPFFFREVRASVNYELHMSSIPLKTWFSYIPI